MRQKIRETLFTKSGLITVLTVVLICAFTFTSLLSYNVTRQAVTTSAKTQILPLVSDNIFSEIQQELLTPIHNSSLMANDEFLIDLVHSGEQNAEEIVRYLQRIKSKYGYFSSFYVSAITQNYYYYDGVLKRISPDDAHDVWYYNFVQSGKEYDLDVDTDEATQGTLTIFINHRLQDQQGNFLGVTGVGLEMRSVGATLEAYRQRFGYLIYMIDANGLIQVHPDPAVVLSTNIKDLPGLGALSSEILSGQEGTRIYEFRDQRGEEIISSRYFPDLEWYLIVQQDKTQSLNQARQYLYGNLAIGVAVTGLVILLVMLMINLFHRRLEALAINDELTGICNRRKFQEHFQKEIASARRYSHPLSLLMLDIDRFKSVNDTHGHHAGDEYLRQFAAVLKREIREVDVFGRWGGEEFVVLLPKADAQQAFNTAERLRQAAAAIAVDTGKGSISRTISIGVATCASCGLDMDEMIKQADQAMYRAKQEGRNRTCLAGSEQGQPGGL